MVVFPWVIRSADSVEALARHARAFTHVSPTWVSVGVDGKVRVEADPRVAEVAAEAGLKLVPLVANEGFRVESARAALEDAAARRRLAKELAELVLDLKWDGLNLDLEGPWALRSEYTALVAAVCERLGPCGKEVSVDVVAQTGPPVRHSEESATWADPYDYPALGRRVDRFIIMGYDFHYRSGPPGPVGPAWWLRQVLNYATAHVPPSKVVLGLPLYGYHWQERPGGGWEARAVGYAQAESLRRQHGAPLLWDYDAYSRHFAFTDGDGRLHVVHFDDAASIERKLELVRSYGLSGVAFWRLGLEDPAVWERLGR